MKKNRLKKFEFRNVPRSKINPAPYNPRMMDAGARKKLRGALQKYGLVEPLVWNERTGNLVGGHQRLREMDKLMGYPDKADDYEVPCAVVDLDDKAEKELNILLNNPNLQGEYDWDALAQMFAGGEANPFDVGFELPELQVFLGDDVAAEIAEMYDMALESDPMMGDVEAISKEADQIELIKARKREYDAAQEADIPENYLLVVFPSYSEKGAVLKAWNLPADTRVIDMRRFVEVIQAEVEAEVEKRIGEGHA